MKTLSFLLITLLSWQATAANYKYSELIIKDYDEMLGMVQALVKKSQKAAKDGEGDAEALEHLREATKLILSRPDSDNMVAKLIPEVRRELNGFSAFEDTFSGLSAEAIDSVKNTKNAISVQSTALVILENILAQINPEMQNNQDFRRVAEKIRDAKLKVSDDVKKDRKLRGMLQTPNPSEQAKKLLEGVAKYDKEHAKQKAKQAEEEQKQPTKGKKILTDD